jgi:hypothetical protein
MRRPFLPFTLTPRNLYKNPVKRQPFVAALVFFFTVDHGEEKRYQVKRPEKSDERKGGNMKRNRLKILAWIVAGLMSLFCLFTVSGLADDHGKGRGKGWFEHERDHHPPFRKGGDNGNETAGQITAWLLVAANIPVAISLFIKGINRFAPVEPGVKSNLTDFNRFQKKQLMRFHYFMNPIILGLAFWHWLTSCCRSTALPEWGLLVMAIVITLGILLKLKLCPPSLRKSVYRIHTQPLVFISMILALTIGHAIID